MTSAQLEQQFQARIAQAKEAARLASIAAAARSEQASHAQPFATIPSVPGLPYYPTSSPPVSSKFTEPLIIKNVPLDIKNRIDRLVEFVARNGAAFEATAKQREMNNPDFAFLKPGGLYSDYYEARKRQVCGTQSLPGAPHMKFSSSLPPQALTTSPNSFPLVSTNLCSMSVGGMANVCKFARTKGVEAYAPIPLEVILNAAKLPPVEQARLEIRLAEFYQKD
ncbi:uncharacterized protein CCR75_004825 [Bremia lactucae]|uniref:SURP motif domain-containing protein n=1 Tax=Bremia lactucae TaxID=4779 RepID=A0A976IDT1_BRELC|nr:hypothetical protein CCR75_004825 [Bremia lactucae]